MPAQRRNRLAAEKSPYLLQHADNPVDWYPWGEAAFEKARKEDKPVFLSIGYATCHWCHVMAHESFEDSGVAGLMNRAFVNIKVDREERPDIDNTYMLVCQMLTGSGGWPLNIFMTPDKKPFYAATYIPKAARHGRPGMRELIPWLNGLWNDDRDKIFRSANEITEAFRKSTRSEAGETLSESILDETYKQFKQSFDEQKGGFGDAPKFPTPHNLTFLLRYRNRRNEERALEMAEKTLTEMRRGGIFDHIGFGFHRYSTDRKWLVPHFEKMLYDQALLAIAYTEAWQAGGRPEFRQTAEEVLTYALRELRDENGGFYSAEDADSEGVEGKFYVWSIPEIRRILPAAEAELAIEIFNLKEAGNFRDEVTGELTGQNIPHLNKPYRELAAERNLSEEDLRNKMEAIRNKLFEAREQRIHPLLDDKILTDWNGLIIAALARAGKVFGRDNYILKAEEAAAFLLDRMCNSDGSLLHRYRDGEAAITAHADDYAFLIWGLLELYEATFKPGYLNEALRLNEIFTNRFWDADNGGFFFTAEGSEELLGRKKESYDGAVPSGNSIAMINLLRLGRITATPELEEKAERIGRAFASEIRNHPTGYTAMLQALDFAFGPSFEVVIAGDPGRADTTRMVSALNKELIPNKVVVFNSDAYPDIRQLAPYTKGQPVQNGKATAYVCREYSCNLPTNDPEKMMELLGIQG